MNPHFIRGPVSGRLQRCLVAAALAALAVAASVGTATANTPRYAAPGGTLKACTLAMPCDIHYATVGDATNPVNPGDEVILKPGTYMLGTPEVDITSNLDVHGMQNQPSATLTSSSTQPAVYMSDPNAKLHDVRIDYSGSNAPIYVLGGTLNRAFVHNTTSTFGTCYQTGGTIRDSVCFSDGVANGTALGSNDGSPTAANTATVRNVTAVASGSGSRGISYGESGTNGAITVDAKSVIAEGALYDVEASTGATATATTTITLAYSNYASRNLGGTMGTRSITDPATANNQTTDPVFANAMGGDFHELTGSPTIDKGILDASSGTSDPDGNPRTRCAAPDIGAYEAPCLTVSLAGSGSGSVTAGASLNCPGTCSQSYSPGAMVTLTATPAGSTFTGWSGGGCGGAGTCTVTMSADQAVTANFTAIPASPPGPTGQSGPTGQRAAALKKCKHKHGKKRKKCKKKANLLPG